MAVMGQDEGLPERLDPDDEAAFPNLAIAGYVVTSRKSDRYNCISYAAGDGSRQWDPWMYYWPPGAKRSGKIEGLVSAFEVLGYEICVGPDVEEGYDKVLTICEWSR